MAFDMSGQVAPEIRLGLPGEAVHDAKSQTVVDGLCSQ